MKKLLIVRHGAYNDNDRLSEHGKEQMTELAKFVQTSLNGNSVLILSSSAPRASDSAKAMEDILKVGFEEIEELWDDNYHRGDSKKSYELIKARENDADIIIVITHLEFTEYLPKFFLKDIGIEARCSEVGKGEAWQINVDERTVERVPK